MEFVVAPGGVFSRMVGIGPVRWDADHYCSASALTPEEAELFGVSLPVETPRPAFDPVTQDLVELDPIFVDGAWARQWSVVDLPAEVAAQRLADADARRIASLWQAAHDVEFSAISGSAVGLVTLGVLQGRPKCLAVMAWIQSLWGAYYERKFGGSSDVDFSSFVCPHTVPELMEELGV